MSEPQPWLRLARSDRVVPGRITQSNISHIMRGHSWRHLEDNR